MSISRRVFIAQSLASASLIVVSKGVSADRQPCDEDFISGEFNHGVASGDPLQDRVILWTRVTPAEQQQGRRHNEKKHPPKTDAIWVTWQVATDEAFKRVVISGATSTNAKRDYTLKVDARGLKAGKTYYYRFLTTTHTSPVGRTKTLPKGKVAQVKLAVISCSNYPAGLFHVYREVAQLTDINAIVHLGDYIYEYPRGGYASENAAALGREVLPATELFDLTDYRTRYAQYRTDKDLQAAHASAPFIAIWDDHEIANNTWQQGAENHNAGEGDFSARLAVAIQAYAEWMPIRPMVEREIAELQRNFQFGDLVNLIMLDTRVVGRDQQLELGDYFDATGMFNKTAFAAAIENPERRLLGEDQFDWLEQQLATSKQTWQVLGQQVLMGKVELPTAIITQQLSVAEFLNVAKIAAIAAVNPALLTAEQGLILQQKGNLLKSGNLPYNLDAWDGYPIERLNVFFAALEHQNNLVVLTGDTHNAWANNLEFEGQPVGVEFAAPSITSPGIEEYLNLQTLPEILQAEGAVQQLVNTIKYANLSNRGYMKVTFTPDDAMSEWIFVNTVKSAEYSVDATRAKTLRVAVNSNKIDP